MKWKLTVNPNWMRASSSASASSNMREFYWISAIPGAGDPLWFYLPARRFRQW